MPELSKVENGCRWLPFGRKPLYDAPRHTAFTSKVNFRMNKQNVLMGLPLVLLVAIVAGIYGLPQAHASGFPGSPGTICLLDSSSVGSLSAPGPCAVTSSYTFNGPFPSAPQTGPTQIRVAVYVNGSAGLNGFDITLLSNSSVLAPAGADLTGSILSTASGSPTVVLDCVGTTLVSGSTCSATDNANTLHLAATTAPGGFVPGPATGLLFTAVYNIVGKAPGPIGIGFQTGCSQTSVAGGVCVTIPNGTLSPDSETVQGATFDNSSCATACSIPWVAVTSSVSSVTVPQGASSGNALTLFANAENGWPGFGTDTVTFSTTQTPGFTAPAFGAGINSCSTNGSSCNVSLIVSDSTPGTYSITVQGTYVTFDSTLSTTDTLVGTTVVQVNVQAVSWTINAVAASSAQTFYMAQGASNPMSLILTAKSLGGYTGTVSYQTNTLTDGGTGASFTYPASFVLGSGATVSQTVTVTATAYGTALYQAALITSAPTLLNQSSAVLTIHVTGFGITAASSAVTFAAFGSASDSISLQSLPAGSAGFAGKVTVSRTIAGGALTVTCPASLTLAAGGTATGNCTFSGSSAGTFLVTVKGVGGTNGAIANSTVITVTVTSVAPSFSISASPSSLSGPINSNPFSGITVKAAGGLSGTVTLSYASSPNTGIVCTFSNTGVPLPSGSVTFSCSSTIAGIYAVTVTGVDKSVTNSVTLTFTFSSFSLSASPSTVNTTPGIAGNSTITATPINGFNGAIIALGITVSPSSGLSCSTIPATITGGSGTSTLSCTGVGGSYAVTITGTSGSVTESTTLAVNVADFTLAASPSSLTLQVGPPAGTSMITVGSLGGFADTVAFTASAPAGFGTIFSPNAVTISGTSLLTIGVSPPAVPGTYLVNVTGTSGSLTHTITITVTVTSAPSIPPPFFTQSTWNHRFSLSKYNDVQTWTFGVKSNSTSTIYVSVSLAIASSTGSPTVLTSPVFALSHNKNVVGINLSQAFSPSQTGETFSFTLVIHWGTTATTDPSQLPFTSTLSNGAPTSGTFTVLA